MSPFIHFPLSSFKLVRVSCFAGEKICITTASANGMGRERGDKGREEGEGEGGDIREGEPQGMGREMIRVVREGRGK